MGQLVSASSSTRADYLKKLNKSAAFTAHQNFNLQNRSLAGRQQRDEEPRMKIRIRDLSSSSGIGHQNAMKEEEEETEEIEMRND